MIQTAFSSCWPVALYPEPRRVVGESVNALFLRMKQNAPEQFNICMRLLGWPENKDRLDNEEEAAAFLEAAQCKLLRCFLGQSGFWGTRDRIGNIPYLLATHKSIFRIGLHLGTQDELSVAVRHAGWRVYV